MNDSVAYSIAGNVVDRNANQNGCGYREDVSFTLNTVDRHAVALDCRNMAGNEELSGTIQAKEAGGYSLNYINPVVYDARGNGEGGVSPTLTGDHQNRITDYTALIVEGKNA